MMVIAANFLRELFANADCDERPTIQAELASRSIIVRGTENQVAEVRQALAKLGETGGSPSALESRTGIRRVRVGDDRAGRIAESTRRFFSNDTEVDGAIRVVVPGSNDSTTEEPEPEKSQTESLQPELSIKRLGRYQTAVAGLSRMPSASTATESLGTSANGQPTRFVSQVAPGPPPAGSRVQIEVDGDEIVVASGDPDAADAVEEVIRELARQMPARKSWTVFYLRVAEAEKAATQLVQLINDPSARVFTSGVFLADTYFPFIAKPLSSSLPAKSRAKST